MLIPNKKRISIGDSTKIDGNHYVVEELFIADSTRWVRTSSHRKKYTIGIYGKKLTYYDIENHYMTEGEWMRAIKQR